MDTAIDVPNVDVPGSDASDDASNDPCMRSDGVRVAAHCITDDTSERCVEGTTDRCEGRCIEFRDMDALGMQVWNATCISEGEELCEPDTAPSCTDGVIRTCVVEPLERFAVTRTVDCRSILGFSSATCIAAGDSFVCDAPESVACDPDTHEPSCDDGRLLECMSTIDTAGPVVVRRGCGAGRACFTSRLDASAVCLGADAVASDDALVPYELAMECHDELTVRVFHAGYEYGLRCPVTTRVTEDGEETFQPVCVVDGAGGFSCQHPDDARPCTEGARCVSAASTAAEVCVDQGDGRRVTATRWCQLAYERVFGGRGYVETGCTDGTCENVGLCEPTDDPVCISNLRIFCGESGFWQAEECATRCAGGVCT